MGDQDTTAERLAKVEVAVEHIREGVTALNHRLDQLFDQLEKRYVQVSVYKETVNRLHERLDAQETAIVELRTRADRAAAKVPPWAAASISFLVTLVGALLARHAGL